MDYYIANSYETIFNFKLILTFFWIYVKRTSDLKYTKEVFEEVIKNSINLEEVEKLGFSATGRKYGVSDNTIRKWIKNYNKAM